MAIVTWIFRAIVVIALFFLAVQNTAQTRFTIFNDISVDLPLFVFLFSFFFTGVILGLLMILPKYLSLKWGARKLRKEVESQKLLLSKVGEPPVNESVDVPMTM